MESSNQRIAVIGSGISGVVAAYLLAKEHRVTLFEKNSRLGGHTNTVVLDQGPDEGTGVDTGFIVLNDQTYPNFHRFLAELGVAVRSSCMSFGYYCEESGLTYAGTGINGLLARRSNAINPCFWKMLLEAKRFSSASLRALPEGELRGISLGEFLDKGKFDEFFRKHYLIPISAAIWSSSDEGILEFPAEMFVKFFKNHGLLSLKARPRWQTVVGGSHSYLSAFREQFRGEVRLSSPVLEIKRLETGIELSTSEHGKESFDKVVIATHADEALAMLIDPSPAEQSGLGAWSYSKNRTLLHTYKEILPPSKRAWASWNYRRKPGVGAKSPVFVTYHMNRLQGLNTKKEYCVTLNPPSDIPDSEIVREIEYTHPVYTNSSLASQSPIKALSGERNTFFCGAYLGSGFHEDGVSSALEVTRQFGLAL